MLLARRVRPASHHRFGSRLAAILLLVGSLASNVSQAWTVLLLCPEEYPGPPDCFPCQMFGDTSALDDDPHMSWLAARWGSTYGHFDIAEGENVYSNHYHCPYDMSTRSVDLGVFVQISEIPASNADDYQVVCTGGGEI